MNFFSDDLRRDPFPAYAQMRNRFPVLHMADLDLWAIFDYDCVKRAIGDHDAFSSSLAKANRPNPRWLVFFDPPRHTQLRALIMRAFTPRVVANLAPRIQQLSRELLHPHIERGQMDLAADFAEPLPMMVIAEMIGIPVQEWRRFRRWSDTIVTSSSYAVGAREQWVATAGEAAAVGAEMNAYLQEWVEHRRLAPRDDLLTALVEAEVEGERLTQEDILGFFQLLLIAGNETTANLIGNAILCLAQNPDQLARLRAGPGLLPSAIEEVMRYRSPVQWIMRVTSREVEMHGQTIPGGRLVLAFVGAVNRDSKQFANPDRFDITREPNPHLAFGHGIHFCLGAPLARLEGRIALSHFLERIGAFELAGDGPWTPRKALNLHGPASLPIRFVPAGRGAAQSDSG
jgi:cytochrome P450